MNSPINRTEAFANVREALGRGDTHLGDVIWVDIDNVDMLRSEIRDAFVRNGLDAKLAPDDATPDAAFGVACSLFRQDKDSPIFLKRVDSSAKRRGSDVLIVRQTRQGMNGLDQLTVEARVGLQGGSFGIIAEGPQFYSDEVQRVVDWLRNAFHHARDYANGSELSKSVVDAILGTCSGIRMRDRGSVYYVNANKAKTVRALQAAVNSCGNSHLAVLELNDGSSNVVEVQRSATNAFESELRAITEELKGFREDTANGDGPRKKTLEGRLADYKALSARVELYAEILGDKRTELLAGIATAKRNVLRLIDQAA